MLKKEFLKVVIAALAVFAFTFVVPPVDAADNANVVYEGTHNFSECLERLGCSDNAHWGPCGDDSFPFSEPAAYEKAMHHIKFTLLKTANVAAEIKNIKKCHHGCKAWFDQKVSGKWKYVGDGMWQAAPGNYRLNILSDGFLGCGVPYKQMTFCPSSCTVKLNAYPADATVDPKDAVAIDSPPKKVLSIEDIEKKYCEWGEKHKTWKDGSIDSHALFSKTNGGGEFVNLLDTLGVDWASRFSCVSLQWKTLYFLAEQKKGGKLGGWEYIPIECWGERPSELFGHHAVVVYPTGGDWRKNGYVLDPHPSQKGKGSVKPIKEWAGWLRKFTSFDNTQIAENYGGKMVGGAFIRQYDKGYKDDYILTQNPKTIITSWETSSHDCVKIGISGPVSVFVTNSKGKHYGLLPDGSWIFEFNAEKFDPWKINHSQRYWHFEFPDDDYKVTIIGIGSGSAQIVVLFNNRIFKYPPVQVSLGDNLTVTLDPKTPMTSMTTLAGNVAAQEFTLDKFVAIAEGTSISTHSSTSMSGYTQQQLHPIADAYVYAYNYRNWNRSNRGKYDQLRAGWHPTGGESRAYIKFDLSNVDPSKVTKAVLKLYHFQTAGNDNVDLGIYRVTGPWKEGTDTYHSGRTEKTAAPGELSWVQQPPIDTQPVKSFNPGRGLGDWIEVDITPLVKQWLSGTPNYGLVIKSIGHLDRNVGASVYHFASRERRAGLDQPKGENKAPALLLGNYSTGVSHTGSTHEPNGSAPDISGTWKWFDGETIHIYPNGTATDRFKGKWQANWNGSGFTYTINWNNGQYIDSLVLHGDTLDGHNQNGTHVWGKRIHSESWKTGNTIPNGMSGQVNTVTSTLSSGTYRVEQGHWKSTWKLRVSNGQISGTSEWSCCPGHRIDAVRGTISGNSVVIERDCSGQGWNGSCRQTYRGEIKGGRITGPCSGTGLNAGDTWVLYLNGGSSLQPSIEPRIGSIWQVVESCAAQNWIGTWIRRPGTKTFDATWKSEQTGQEVRDVIDFQGIQNGIVTLYRHGIGGTYTGKISPDGISVRDGDASWYHGHCHWTANINE